MTFPRGLLLLLSLGTCHAQEQPATSPPPAAFRQEEHPFLDHSNLPQWSKMTPEQAKIDFAIAIRRHDETIRAIENVSEPTYENTFGRYADDQQLLHAWLHWKVLASLHDSPEIRTATEQLEPLYLKVSASDFHNAKVWAVLKKAASSDWVNTLPPDRQRLIAEIMELFRMAGADLPPEGKARLSAIEQELSRLCRLFSSNVIDSTKSFHIQLTAKDNIAPSLLARIKSDSSDLRLTYSQARSILAYVDDEQLRKKIWLALQTIATGPYDNEPVIKQILALRREKEQLLGYAAHADQGAAHSMLGTEEAAMQHIRSMLDRLQPQDTAEMESLRRLKAEHTNNPAARIEPWDQAYYFARLFQSQSRIAYWAISDHFPADNVLKGMFGIYSRLYGITVSERSVQAVRPGSGQSVPAGTVEVWHRHVRFFEIHDRSTGKLLGSFYIDAGKRPEKRPGIWTQEIKLGSARTPGLIFISLNDTWSSHLDHAGIEQLFHEFGHVLHRILFEGDDAYLGCLSMARDFSEFPAIINEQWTWDRDILQQLCPDELPEDIYEQILVNRNITRIGNDIFQYKMALLDLELHSRNLDDGRPLDDLVKDILQQDNAPYAAFGIPNLRENLHLFGGNAYAGLYYVYPWGNMLAEDAFTKFREKGLLNPKTGAEFRRTILSQGNRKPSIELYRDFMGRDPKPDALLQTLGIVPASPNVIPPHPKA